jgi:hypothetical protein
MKVMEVASPSDADTKSWVGTLNELITNWKDVIDGRPGIPGLRELAEHNCKSPSTAFITKRSESDALSLPTGLQGS